ncbi:methylenetetrahydrofolate reductase C-terminal domain-containing protein [Pseudomonas zhanjiangensis]|uniref:Methylenetetrahydrofolate reductase C-terminal domain-containing protein n=1 Tax=Pseudomonas zhanjiangensis TaxID=3239015 RepID=A0ABV3YZ00_9PSED
MRRVRYWSVDNAGFLEHLYTKFEAVMVALHPLWSAIGYQRIERPVAAAEQLIKGFLFDCRMCGQCMLSSNGMSCPMNCPKTLRNGPCGGVRSNGNCEVNADMRCVFVEAARGSQKMQGGDLIKVVQLPVDHRLQGSSSWLRIAQEKGLEKQALKNPSATQASAKGE